MGATTFFATAVGKTAGEAFDKARRDAQYEYGHGGYTGTIAEKDGFTFVTLPPRVTVHSVQARLFGAEMALEERDAKPEWPVKATAKDRADLAWLYKHFGQMATERMVQDYRDKWGPALAFELRGAERDRARDWHHVPKGSPKKVYAFMGYASE